MALFPETTPSENTRYPWNAEFEIMYDWRADQLGHEVDTSYSSLGFEARGAIGKQCGMCKNDP